MAENTNPVNIREVLAKRMYPTIMMWNRLEGRPRTHHFDKALKAEVRDALWMLTRQWQLGEYKADDAGSSVAAKIHIATSYLDKYQPGNRPLQDFKEDIPLEALVEQKKIAFKRGGVKISLDIRLQLGRYWLKLLENKALNYSSEYIKKYPFEIPAQDRQTDYVYAHKDTLQKLKAIQGRCLDGYLLLEKIAVSGLASEDITTAEPDKSALDDLGDIFTKWYETIFLQPVNEENNAWLPDRLEYKFACSGVDEDGKKTLSAEEYYSGHLDWFSFNIAEDPGPGDAAAVDLFTDSFIPTHVEFDGMPNTRWWKFEDGKTSFGDIKPSTTDLAKLLLIEFGLIFANDWFLIPFTLPIGALSDIRGVTVTNNFGETFWIESAEKANHSALEWSMFKLHSEKFNETLLLAPAAIAVQESAPLEEVMLIRDEMANMVWGVEKSVPAITGEGTNGNEYALRTRKYHEEIVKGSAAAAAVPYAADISYLAMTNVPENWIPLVPVHAAGHSRQIQLQRASMLRIIEGDPGTIISGVLQKKPQKIKPQTSILREGLENNKPYYVHEEEVSRAGTRVSQSFQRTRWTNGEIFVWLGTKKKTGKGEGSSGLAFDQITDVKKTP